MKLIIDITNIEDPDSLITSESDGGYMEIIIKNYIERGVKPSAGDFIIGDSDITYEIISMCFCDWKIMYELKAIS